MHVMSLNQQMKLDKIVAEKLRDARSCYLKEIFKHAKAATLQMYTVKCIWY